MNKRQKKKYLKDSFKHYRGRMIWINSPLSAGNHPKGHRVGLFYDETGNDCYFKTVGEATRYIDRHWSEFQSYDASSWDLPEGRTWYFIALDQLNHDDDIHPNDKGLHDFYSVEAFGPEEALDLFHESISVSDLEHFDITVTSFGDVPTEEINELIDYAQEIIPSYKFTEVLTDLNNQRTEQ